MPKHSRGSEGSRSSSKNKKSRIRSKDVESSTPNTLDTYEKRPKRRTYEKENEVELAVEDDSEELEEGSKQMEDEEERDDEVEVQTNPSVYDNLLQKLETSSRLLDNGRQKSKCKDKSVSNFEQEGDKKSAFDKKNHSVGTKKNTGRNTGLGDASKSSEDEASDMALDDDEDVSDAEDGADPTSSGASESKFITHTTHKLSEQDTETLLERKWEYKWDMPAFDSTTVKWMGTGECCIEDADVAPYGLKVKLYKHWLDTYNGSGGKKFEASKQKHFFNLCSSYRDILHHQKKGFYQKGSDEDSSIMDSYVMHSLNHVFKTRDLVTKNNTKLAKHEEMSNEELKTDDCFLDHGFTRPKVLILLPLASIAHRLVRRLVHLVPSANKVNVEYMDRFNKGFGVDAEEHDDELAKNVNLQRPSKPSDYQALFGGNNKDDFMVGVKFTRKSIRLYSDFYSSDLIIASPLGLITVSKIFSCSFSCAKGVVEFLYVILSRVVLMDH